MAAFSELKGEFAGVNTSVLGASVDPIDKAAEIQANLEIPIAHGVTRDQADAFGGWWEERRQIVQPSEFIIGRDGKVVSATYSTGPIGRMMPEDAIKLINFIESQKNKG